MFTIKQTDEFTAWIDGIRDGMTRRRLGSTQARDIAAALRLAATIED